MIIASKGAAGVTGAGLATLAGGLSSHRPELLDGVGLIVGIDRFMSEARALTNFAGNAVATVLIGTWTGGVDREQLDAVLAGERPVRRDHDARRRRGHRRVARARTGDGDGGTPRRYPLRVRLRAVLRTQPGLRLLGPSDLPAMLELTACDPVVNVFADYRARLTQLDPRWLGGEVWGYHEDGRLVSACHAAANLVPVQATPEALVAFAERAASQQRRCATIVGPDRGGRAAVAAPRAALGGAPRGALAPAAPADRLGTRRSPPTRWYDGPSAPTSTRSTRPAWRCTPRRSASRPRSAAARTSTGPGSRSWSRRAGRSPASRTAGWSSRPRSPPPRRTPARSRASTSTRRAAGEGLAAAGMAAVVQLALRDIAPVVSLYVNEHNLPARAAYARAGFQQTGTFSTIMF